MHGPHPGLKGVRGTGEMLEMVDRIRNVFAWRGHGSGLIVAVVGGKAQGKSKRRDAVVGAGGLGRARGRRHRHDWPLRNSGGSAG